MKTAYNQFSHGKWVLREYLRGEMEGALCPFLTYTIGLNCTTKGPLSSVDLWILLVELLEGEIRPSDICKTRTGGESR